MDKLMLPFLIKLCYLVGIFGGMLQATSQWAGFGNTSGQTGNIVKLGQALSGSIAKWDGDGKELLTAYRIILRLICFCLGNFGGGVWTNHDARKSLKTVGNGLILTGGVLVVVSSACVKEKTFVGFKEEMTQLLCFAMGLSNGIIVTTTGYVATVSATGSATDIGLLVGGFVVKAGRTEEKRWKVAGLAIQVCCFTTGSLLGSILYYRSRSAFGIRWGCFVSLLVPSLGYILCGVIARVHGHIMLSREEREALLAAEHVAPLSAPLGQKSRSSTRSLLPSVPSRSLAGCHDQSASSSFTVRAASAHQEEVVEVPRQVPKTILPLVYGSYFACFCAAMIDIGSMRMLPSSPTPTHITGPTVKFGMGLAAYVMGGSAKEKNLFYTSLKLVISFSVGAVLAGMMTCKATWKTRTNGAMGLILMSTVLFIGVGGSFKKKYMFDDLQFACGLCMGFQNGLLCAVTGFARTTHMTGSLANLGMCLGHASNPDKVTPALLFKAKSNAILASLFTLGIVLMDLVIMWNEGSARWIIIPASGLFILGWFELGFAFRRFRQIHRETEQMGRPVLRRGSSYNLMRREQLQQRKKLFHLASAGDFVDSVANVHVGTFGSYKSSTMGPMATAATATASCPVFQDDLEDELDDAIELASSTARSFPKGAVDMSSRGSVTW